MPETSIALNSGRNGEHANDTSMNGDTRVLNIINMRGLHARASAKFVKCVEKFDADVRVSKDGYDVGGTSIMGLMMLAASPGCAVHVTANGPEANDVLDALEALVNDKFGEGE